MLFSDWRAEGPRELVGNLLRFLGPQLGVGTLSLSPTLPLVKANPIGSQGGKYILQGSHCKNGEGKKNFT